MGVLLSERWARLTLCYQISSTGLLRMRPDTLLECSWCGQCFPGKRGPWLSTAALPWPSSKARGQVHLPLALMKVFFHPSITKTRMPVS